jgi:dTDP-4-amino-4,6-dideoxygalactose transaminase
MKAFSSHASDFAIGFDSRDRARVLELWDRVLSSNQWSEGEMVQRFEAAWEVWNGLPAVAASSWAGGAMAALEFAGVRGETVLCPSNTFMATPLSVLKAGGRVAFVDCNRDDLCVSLEDFQAKAEKHKPKAAWLVHIGGHIAFDVAEIATFCADAGIFLIEDCAHAHGADWDGRKPGSWGDAGVYSLYATKTISTGEGGVLVTRNEELLEFARAYRNYGKPSHQVEGLNFRMSEFTAALGLVQTERLDEIVRWKNAYARSELDARYPARVELPEGMISGLYKYIVFDQLERSTGRVYDTPCHRLMGHADDLPNTDWVAGHHSCVPLYYHGPGGLRETVAGQPVEELLP